jgi:hypothetical protein
MSQGGKNGSTVGALPTATIEVRKQKKIFKILSNFYLHISVLFSLEDYASRISGYESWSD